MSKSNTVHLPEFESLEILDEDEKDVNKIRRSLDKHGISFLSEFLPMDHANKIRSEVHDIYDKKKLFYPGETIKEQKKKSRSDWILWVGADYAECRSVKLLCDKLDKVVMAMVHDKIEVKTRTRSMVACYPGHGTHYTKHVDNPIKDGRVLTALYYLNEKWDKKKDGGCLRIYPRSRVGKVPDHLDLVPEFNTLVLFYSDSRNPHEVLPTYRQRFAITHWYFDYHERQKFENDTNHVINSRHHVTAIHNKR